MTESIITDNLATTLSNHFGSRKTFTKAELETVLKDFYNRPYPNTTYRWRIHDLKARGIIENMARGLYAFPQVNKTFQPRITPEAAGIFQDIKRSLPYTHIALTDTAWLNEFMVHQVFKTYIIIDVERDATLSVFNNLPEEYKQSYLNPKREIFDNYITNGDRPVIIHSMVSESPTTTLEKITIASLEKLLVDLVADELFYLAQQEERKEIFANAIQKYFVNMNKLKRYARRRNRTEEIEELINQTKK